MAGIKNGDKVKVHYTGKLEDGAVFDSSNGREPLEFTVGNQELIAGFDSGVLGMAVGDKKTLTLPPEEAYGSHEPQLLIEVPLERLPDSVKVDDYISAEIADQPMRFIVKEINGDKAKIDGNHPLAGKTLVFDLEIVSIN